MTNIMRVFVIGMCKEGTTTLHYALQSAGFNSCHWQCKDGRYVGEQMCRAKRENKPLLTYLPEFTAFAQMDVCLPKKQLMVVPNVTDFEKLDRQYPGSLFILNVRPEANWLRSVRKWGDLEKRLQMVSRTLDILEWRRQHHEHVRNYFKGRKDLLILNIESPTAKAELQSFLGRPVRNWSKHNSTVHRKRT